jgi:hypothetical protein
MGYMHKTSVRALLATGNEVGCSCPVVKKKKVVAISRVKGI